MSEKHLEDFEDLYETAPCGYVSVSPEGAIVKANLTIRNWLGFPPEDLTGKSLHEILSFGGRIAVETHLAPLLRMQGHVHEIALDLLTADGEKIPTIANAAEKRDGEGRHLFTRLTFSRLSTGVRTSAAYSKRGLRPKRNPRRSAKLQWFANNLLLFLATIFAIRSRPASLAFACLANESSLVSGAKAFFQTWTAA